MISFYYPPSYSGSAVQATNLCRHLRAHGVEAMIVSANLTGSPSRDVVDGLPVYRLPAWKSDNLQIPTFWMSLLWFLIRRRGDYDVIHAHGTFSHAIASLAGRWLQKPSVLKIAMGHSDLAFHRLGRILGRVSRFLVRRFDRYVATSMEIRDECLERGLDPARIRVIPNGVDTDVFHPAGTAEEKIVLRRTLGLPDVPLVAYVGVIDARKNVDGILRVWKRVRDAGAQGHLLLIGPRPRGEERTPGRFHNEMLRYIEEQGLGDSVTLTGPRNDVPSCLRSSDIFIFPSRREGMPNALLEAAASGLACVASRIGGSVDIVRDGESGFLFDVDDEPGMAAAVTRLLRDPAETARIGQAARDAVLETFSLHAVARRYFELYQELMQDSRRGGAG
jgi:glycosyltransferase involved in cell wall biosynthesis